MKENSVPCTLSNPIRVPFPLLPKVEHELNRMQRLDIIEPMTEPSDWCAPMVPVLKSNGDVTIYCDLTKLNQCVKRERFVIPMLEDILLSFLVLKRHASIRSWMQLLGSIRRSWTKTDETDVDSLRSSLRSVVTDITDSASK